MGDGNGWVQCSRGHRHWGRFGAAGLLVTDGWHVLLQHRSGWTHEGGTWAIPGGARDSHERPLDAALREAAEETTLDLEAIIPGRDFVDDHGGWSYTTILARADPIGAATIVEPANAESTEITWWSIEDVDALDLHRGFAASWPTLRDLVVGSVTE